MKIVVVKEKPKTPYIGVVPSQYNSQNEMPKLANEFKM